MNNKPEDSLSVGCMWPGPLEGSQRHFGVTIAIPTHNRAAELVCTLGTLARLQIPDDVSFEVLVVDNASQDGTEKAVQLLTPQFSGRLRYAREPRLGISHARNRAAALARYEIIAFLDDDVDVDPGWLSRLIGTYRETESAAVGGKADLIYPRPPPEWLDPRLEGFLSKVDQGPVRRPALPQELFGLNLSIRRDWLLRIGGFRNDLGRRGQGLESYEETEMLERLAAAGGLLTYEPCAVVGHRVPVSRLRRRYLWSRCYWEGVSGFRASSVGPPAFRRLVRTSLRLIGRVAGTVYAALVSGPGSQECFYRVTRVALALGYLRAGFTDRWNSLVGPRTPGNRPFQIASCPNPGDAQGVAATRAKDRPQVLPHDDGFERTVASPALLPGLPPAMEPQLVSVIIPIYQRTAFVRQAVESVLAQDYPNVEIVVVDDGSETNIPAALGPLSTHVRYLRIDHGGAASARNAGIAIARGELFLFLDDDDFLEPRALPRLVAAVAPGPMWAAGRFRYVDQTGAHLPGARGTSFDSGDIYEAIIPTNLLGGPSCVLIRKEALRRVGLFDQSLAPAEDYDLWLRLAAEYPIGAVPGEVASYRLHSDRLSVLQWAEQYEAVIRVLQVNRLRAQNGCRNQPGLDRLFLQAQARWYQEYGDELYVMNEFSRARAAWYRAFCLSRGKGSGRLLARCMKSLLPGFLRVPAKALLHWIRFKLA
jgi:glycosyltransferase involved in cell wall biosynthesis